jgi:hypothetical protein
MVVCMPQQRCHNLSSSSWGGCPSAVWLLLLFFRGWETHFISSSVYGIMFGIVPLFLTIYPVRDQNGVAVITCLPCVMALGDFHSRLQSPIVAMYPILCHYNMPRPGVLPFIFFVRKFLQLPVQVPMGFLARPVTAHHAHDDAGTQEYCRDDECSLDHSSVPFILPSTMLIAMAEMNMPASM